MTRKTYLFIFWGLFMVLAKGFHPVHGQMVGKVSQFMSTRSQDINVRRGPGKRYPIDWRFVKKGYPLKVIARYDTWRKIRDEDGAEGWVHQNMLSPRRTCLTKQETAIYKRPKKSSKQMGHAHARVLFQLKKIQSPWCYVIHGQHKGWVPCAVLWGVLDDE